MRIYILCCFFLGVMACQPASQEQKKEVKQPIQQAPALTYHKLQGKTMGTSYNITCAGPVTPTLQDEIDALLLLIDAEISTYNDSSLISNFNKAKESIVLQNTRNHKQENVHFKAVFFTAKNIFEQTNGYFDPTVMPLVNYWGFGYTKKEKRTHATEKELAKLMKVVGFDKVRSELIKEEHSLRLIKTQPKVELDFSAIGKGYGVDAIADLFDRKGIKNYLIEIGGETRARGKNVQGKLWRVGINVPAENAKTSAIHTAMKMQDNSMATSGNYRNFYEVEGKKYTHTINPKTGQSGITEKNTLLSATVIAKECMVADAYATAFMAMGTKDALQLAEKLDDIEAFFIYSKNNGTMGTATTTGTPYYVVE